MIQYKERLSRKDELEEKREKTGFTTQNSGGDGGRP